jgi:hypothetical protein
VALAAGIERWVDATLAELRASLLAGRGAAKGITAP